MKHRILLGTLLAVLCFGMFWVSGFNFERGEPAAWVYIFTVSAFAAGFCMKDCV